MKVGDLVRFPETEYTALILDITDYRHVSLLVTEEVQFKNPTWMTLNELERCAEVVNTSE